MATNVFRAFSGVGGGRMFKVRNFSEIRKRKVQTKTAMESSVVKKQRNRYKQTTRSGKNSRDKVASRLADIQLVECYISYLMADLWVWISEM